MTALWKDRITGITFSVAPQWAGCKYRQYVTGLRPVTSSFHVHDESFSSAECMLGLAPAFIDGFSGLSELKGLKKLKR